MTGAITCPESGPASIDVDVSEAATGTSALNDVSGVGCRSTRTPWSITVRSPTTAFAPGSAEVAADVYPEAGTGRLARVEQTVTLVAQLSSPRARYYVALGDSVAAGLGAPSGRGYADDLLDRYKRLIPRLQLVNFGCGGESTATFISGPSCGEPGGSQLQAAAHFLRAHRRRVAMITIDIGGNDLALCLYAQSSQCESAGLSAIGNNLPRILAQLRQAAGPRVPIYGMNYFNPCLIAWLDGPSGQSAAKSSAVGLDQLNKELKSIYARAGVPVTNVAGAFQVSSFHRLVSSEWGTIPINVDRACLWTASTCKVGGPQTFFGEANAAGSLVIASAFERRIGHFPFRPSGLRVFDHDIPSAALEHGALLRSGR